MSSEENKDDFIREVAELSVVPRLIAQGSQVGTDFQPIGRAQTEKLREREDIHDPSALDVITGMIDPNSEAKASSYMKGHVSEEIINETFLKDASQKFPESTLRINCQTHNAPATFYSRK